MLRHPLIRILHLVLVTAISAVVMATPAQAGQAADRQATQGSCSGGVGGPQVGFPFRDLQGTATTSCPGTGRNIEVRARLQYAFSSSGPWTNWDSEFRSGSFFDTSVTAELSSTCVDGRHWRMVGDHFWDGAFHTRTFSISIFVRLC